MAAVETNYITTFGPSIFMVIISLVSFVLMLLIASVKRLVDVEVTSRIVKLEEEKKELSVKLEELSKVVVEHSYRLSNGIMKRLDTLEVVVAELSKTSVDHSHTLTQKVNESVCQSSKQHSSSSLNTLISSLSERMNALNGNLEALRDRVTTDVATFIKDINVMAIRLDSVKDNTQKIALDVTRLQAGVDYLKKED